MFKSNIMKDIETASNNCYNAIGSITNNEIHDLFIYNFSRTAIYMSMYFCIYKNESISDLIIFSINIYYYN